MGIGPLEIAIVVVILLVIFGPKRIPALGRAIGGGLREFKGAVTGDRRDRSPDQLEPPGDSKASDGDQTGRS